MVFCFELEVGGCLVWLRTWVQSKESHYRTLFSERASGSSLPDHGHPSIEKDWVNSEPKGWGFRWATPKARGTASRRHSAACTPAWGLAGLPRPRGLCGAGWTSSMTALRPRASSCAFCVSSHSQHTAPQISVPFFPVYLLCSLDFSSYKVSPQRREHLRSCHPSPHVLCGQCSVSAISVLAAGTQRAPDQCARPGAALGKSSFKKQCKWRKLEGKLEKVLFVGISFGIRNWHLYFLHLLPNEKPTSKITPTKDLILVKRKSIWNHWF